MSRWAPDAALRLERAALELFAAQGYAATTVPQITARADLTTRTFFRHFADKREVLFLREREFPTIVATLLGQAPASLSPLALVMYGFEHIATDGLDQIRHDLALRRRIVTSDTRLRERELLKSAVLADAIKKALTEQGTDESTSALLSSFAVMLFDNAVNDWLDGNEDRTLLQVFRDTRTQMQHLIAARS